MRSTTREHVPDSEWLLWARQALPRDEASRAVRHLLAGCTPCARSAAREVLRGTGSALASAVERGTVPLSTAESPWLRPPAAGRPWEVLKLGHERLLGMGLLARLESVAPERRSEAIRTDLRFHQWGLYDRLLAGCLEATRTKPQAGVEMAELALVVLECLDGSAYPGTVFADFRAAGLAALANARRLAGRFEEAWSALDEAWDALEEGTGDPLEEAELLSIEASLLYDLGRFERSIESLKGALRAARSAGDDTLRARFLIQRGIAEGSLEPDRAIGFCHHALELLRGAEEPRLELYARHNLAWFLNEAGRVQEALGILELSRPLYAAFADPWTQLRLRWLEGRIARSLGDLAEAEAVLRVAWAGFQENEMPFEQTLVSVDLVESLSAQGKYADAARLARELLPMLEGWGLHAEGCAIWFLFGKAIHDHASSEVGLDEEAFRTVGGYFQRWWRHPLGSPGGEAPAGRAS